MFNIMKDLVENASGAISSTVAAVGDVVSGENAHIAADWIVKSTTAIASEAGRLGNEAINSDLARDAGQGAVLGAIIAVPLPIIGPAIGASIGASLGVYKNLTQTQQPLDDLPINPKVQTDFYNEMIQLNDLKQKGIISEEEFITMKQCFLHNHQQT
jgi:hypothetical protein